MKIAGVLRPVIRLISISHFLYSRANSAHLFLGGWAINTNSDSGVELSVSVWATTEFNTAG